MTRLEEARAFLRDPARVTLKPGTPDEEIERLARKYAAGVYRHPLASYGARHYPRALRGDARPA